METSTCYQEPVTTQAVPELPSAGTGLCVQPCSFCSTQLRLDLSREPWKKSHALLAVVASARKI